MTLNQLASKIAKREGKKHQASIGDIREILKILISLEADARMNAGVTLDLVATKRSTAGFRAWQRTSPCGALNEGVIAAQIEILLKADLKRTARASRKIK